MHPCLLGQKFLVAMNHKSLKQTLQLKVITGSQQNWIVKLLGYNFDNAYKPGIENKGVDALSQR